MMRERLRHRRTPGKRATAVHRDRGPRHRRPRALIRDARALGRDARSRVHRHRRREHRRSVHPGSRRGGRPSNVGYDTNTTGCTLNRASSASPTMRIGSGAAVGSAGTISTVSPSPKPLSRSIALATPSSGPRGSRPELSVVGSPGPPSTYPNRIPSTSLPLPAFVVNVPSPSGSARHPGNVADLVDLVGSHHAAREVLAGVASCTRRPGRTGS